MTTSNPSRWKILTLGLAAALTVSAGLTSYFYQRNVFLDSEYQTLREQLQQVSNEVDLLIDYGNGTRSWHNGTRIPVGATLFNATLQIVAGGLDYSIHPQFGVFVNGINGLKGDPSRFWSIWKWDRGSNRWMLSEVGASELRLHDDDAIAWKLVSMDPRPPKPP